MQHSQPHITLSLDGKKINWGFNSERTVESLIMILSSLSLASLSPPSIVVLTMFYGILLQTPVITILEPVAVQCDHQFSPSDNH